MAPLLHRAAITKSDKENIFLYIIHKAVQHGSDQDKLKCGLMPDVIAAQPCESSVIPFLVPRRKVWLTPATGVLRSNAANIA